MVLKETLIELINNICKNKSEGQTLEIKSANKGCPKKLYDTLSSFSNQDTGGIIIFGVDETKNFEIVGVYDLHNLQKKVTEQCLQMEPIVRTIFTTAEINGKNVCSAEIPGLDLSQRPCYYKGTGRLKGTFIRVGDSDLPMTEYELYSFEAFRKHIHDDERKVERASIKALDSLSIERYVLDKKIDKPKFAQLPNDIIYEILNILRDNSPTLAAVMNFGLYPQGYFPQLCITAIVIPGTEIGDTENNIRFKDNKRIDGNISSMLLEAISFCKRNMKVNTIIDEQTGKRIDKTEYPITAIREAIINALIHRDYSVYTEGTPIQLNIFQDRIEIHSPGNLYGKMTVDQLGKSKPDLRNPALAVMAESLMDVENRYSGIPTMKKEMIEYGLPEPVFENRRNEFVVTLYNKNITELSVEEKILNFCKTPKSKKDICNFLNLKTSFYVMDKYIKPLLNKNLLKMTIQDRPKSKKQKYVKV